MQSCFLIQKPFAQFIAMLYFAVSKTSQMSEKKMKKLTRLMLAFEVALYIAIASALVFILSF
jgi:hypothetical protein